MTTIEKMKNLFSKKTPSKGLPKEKIEEIIRNSQNSANSAAVEPIKSTAQLSTLVPSDSTLLETYPLNAPFAFAKIVQDSFVGTLRT